MKTINNRTSSQSLTNVLNICNAGVEQTASEGSQNLTGKDGENASQGGQIADKGGQNANQFGQVVKDGGENTIEDADNEPG
ncbi:MAG: hypothetical protein ACQEWI_09330 [Bacillota bacterium]